MTTLEEKPRTSKQVNKEIQKLKWQIHLVEIDRDKVLNKQLFPLMLIIKDLEDKYHILKDERIDLQKKEGKIK